MSNPSPRITRLAWITTLMVATLVLAACGAGTDDDPTGRTWELTELEGAAPVDGTSIDLTITDDEVSGTSGCNNYNGPASVGEGTITFGPDFAVTMMACEQPIMDQETKYLNALTRVTAYQMAADELILEDAAGIAVATFR